MSDSVWPHRRQPTRLPCPWDSPGKNTGVGCHFLLQCTKVKSESEVAQLCPTLSDPIDCSLPGFSILGFSKQKYWSGVPLPSPPALVGTFFTTELPWKPSFFITRICWVFVKYIVLWKCLAWTQGTVSMCMCIYLLSYLFIVVSCCKKFMVASNLCEV